MSAAVTTGESEGWAKAYRALRPTSLTVQLSVLILVEIGLFASYSSHDARFHWATHFLVALALAAILSTIRLLVTGAPGPRFILLPVVGWHLFAMAPDLLFRGGVPHSPWMNVFLGHIAVHYVPGGDTTWLVVALLSTGAFATAVALWLRARGIEADQGMPPGIGLTGAAVLRPQLDPRLTDLTREEFGSASATAPSVVLVHGLGASSAFWRPVAQILDERGRHTVVPNLLGFGGSLRIGTHFHLEDQAAAVIRMLEQRGVTHPVLLVGHSVGAAVVARVALDRPDLVARLMLVAPAVFADAAEARHRIGGRSWIARKTMSGSPVADIACGVMCLLRQPISALAPRLARAHHPQIPDDVARGAVTYVWPAYRDALAALLDDNPLTAWLAHPSRPTIVLAGSGDRTVIADDLVALIDGRVPVVRIPGSHIAPLEHPRAVADAIASFDSRETQAPDAV